MPLQCGVTRSDGHTLHASEASRMCLPISCLPGQQKLPASQSYFPLSHPHSVTTCTLLSQTLRFGNARLQLCGFVIHSAASRQGAGGEVKLRD